MSNIIYNGNGGNRMPFPNTGGGATDFIGLTDTPNTYEDQAGLTPIVKTDESGLDFIDLEPPYKGKIFKPSANTWYKIFETNSTEVGPIKADIILYEDTALNNPMGLLRVKSVGIEAEKPILDVYVRSQTKYGTINVASVLGNNSLQLFIKFDTALANAITQTEIYGRRTSDLIDEADPYIQPIAENPVIGSHSSTYDAVLDTTDAYKMHHTFMRGNAPIVDTDFANKKYVDENIPTGNNDKIKTSSDDATNGYMSDKLIAGDNILLSTVDAGSGDLKTKITATGGSSTGETEKKVFLSHDDNITGQVILDKAGNTRTYVAPYFVSNDCYLNKIKIEVESANFGDGGILSIDLMRKANPNGGGFDSSIDLTDGDVIATIEMSRSSTWTLYNRTESKNYNNVILNEDDLIWARVTSLDGVSSLSAISLWFYYIDIIA